MKYFKMLALFLILSESAVFCSDAVICFKENATVKSDSLFLNDIADISGSKPELINKLSSIYIGVSANPGYTRRINAERIYKFHIKPYTHEWDINVLGKNTISKVNTASKCIMGVLLQEKIKRMIFSCLPWEKENVLIEYKYIPEKVIIPYTDYSIELKPDKRCDYKGSEIFDVVFKNNDRVLKTVHANLVFKVFSSVCVANKKIKRNKVIEDKDLKLEEREITEIRHKVYSKKSDIVGKKAKRTIGANRAINIRMVEEPPVISKGEPVKIISIVNTATVSTGGISKEDGIVGEKIRVKNSLNNRTINVYVVGPGLVSVSKPKRGIL